MHIIFGDAPSVMADNYTLLELDTFTVPSKDQVIKTFCVVTSVPVEEFGIMENNKKIHADLITQYRLQNWEFCKMAIENLLGRWGGEVDSFYRDLQMRVEHFVKNPPPEDWDWTILKTEQS